MKPVFTVLATFAVLVTLVGASLANGHQTSVKEGTKLSIQQEAIWYHGEMKEILFIQGSLGIDGSGSWNNGQMMIPDRRTAIEVAEAFLDGMCRDNRGTYIEPVAVWFDEEQGIWQVTFGSHMCLDGDISIALSKTDGRVLRITCGG